MSKQIANKQPSPAELISKTEADIGRLEREREAHVERGAELSGARLDTKLLGVLFCGAAPQENAPPMGRGKGGFRHWVGPSEGDHPARRMAVFIITMVRSFRDEYSGFPLSIKEPRHAWQPRLKDMG